EPPVEETTFARMNFACTVPVAGLVVPDALFGTLRPSPATAVVVSIVWYSASTSFIAPCRTMFTALGAVPKIVCQRTAVPPSEMPVKLGRVNCDPAVLAAGNASLLKLKPTSPDDKAYGGVEF